jgi:hypothetical protein
MTHVDEATTAALRRGVDHPGRSPTGVAVHIGRL